MARNPGCVLVSHVTENTSVGDPFGISGIFLSDQWILTHGTLLSPNSFEPSEYDIRSFLVEVKKDLEKDLITVPRRLTDMIKLQFQYSRNVADNVDDTTRERRVTIVEKNCSLRILWRCPLLHKTFNDLFTWNFEKADKYDKTLLSIFLLLKVETGAKTGDKADAVEGKKILSDFYRNNFGGKVKCAPFRRGAPVEIVSAPFGNVVFLDSVSRGVVSNIFGESGCLILTDANAVPGCEGGPLFALDKSGRRKQICGLVITPLCWCRGEWVEYTFAANLQSCLKKLVGVLDEGLSVTLTSCSSCSARTETTEQFLPDFLDKSVVIVKAGPGWGTGVVVDVPTGTILTCSHVVREAVDNRVKVVLFEDKEETETRDNSKEVWAQIVYRTHDGQPYDVAVLKLEDFFEDLRALALAPRDPVKGSVVMTVGFPFFSSTPASCSRGIISRQTFCMIQTTCCVQSGASGGPVISCSTGEMLGLIVSNAVSANDSGALYPRFNMAVPSSVIREPLLSYLSTGDVSCLNSLSSADPMVQETWNFSLTPRSKM